MSIIDDVKNVAGLIQQAGNLELYGKMLDIQKNALELMEENHRLRSEKATLQENIATLEGKLRLQDDLVFKDNAYWNKSDEGPFCVPCWDGERKTLSRMVKDQPGLYRCGLCNHTHRTDDYRGFSITAL